MSILERIISVFGDSHERYLKSIAPQIKEINELEEKFEAFSNEKLTAYGKEMKERAKKEPLDSLLPEAFALVREAGKRTLQQRHYDEQLMGGIAMHEGKVVEMKTGEGKTLAATLPTYLNSLTGKGVHIVTVNDYLARRDTVWMGQIYDLLGASVGCINHRQSFVYNSEYRNEGDERDKVRDELGGFKVVEDFLEPCSRKEAYGADITYGTNNEFGFDYLRDNMAKTPAQQVQRGFNFVILDEVDFILIDEARTPLIISAPERKPSSLYNKFASLVPKLEVEKHYEVDEEKRVVTLTPEGIDKMENILGVDNIYVDEGIDYIHHMEQALRAQAENPADGNPLYAKDRDYVIRKGEVIIVDEFTGRLMPGRRWSGGLHQAIEAKEGVKIQPESKTMAKITFQNLFRFYDKMSGMTGTALSAAEEFHKVYELDVVAVPTHRPLIRKSLPDRIYKNKKVKIDAVIEEIKERNGRGQPLLIGTRSIEKNEKLSRRLKKENIKHMVLNAKNHEKEAQIIAQAGELGSVTVATNMAGRGVDIKLGGNPPDEKEAERIKKLGGLHVLGTERHEARRIDNQLRGRSGRQGDPGSSQFFLSLEDELLRVFGGDRIKNFLERFDFPEDEPITHPLITNAVSSAQAKIEGMHFDARKRVLDYDNVLNKHREAFYKMRDEILRSDREKLEEKVLELGIGKRELEEIEEHVGDGFWATLRSLHLKIMDFYWMQHLEDMDWLRQSVRLKVYANLDPLVEYKKGGYDLYQGMKGEMEERVVSAVLNLVPRREREKAISRVGKKILKKEKD